MGKWQQICGSCGRIGPVRGEAWWKIKVIMIRNYPEDYNSEGYKRYKFGWCQSCITAHEELSDKLAEEYKTNNA